MSFLHRRSRSASATRPQAPASNSAHLAATQAFLNSRSSQANLSASAAAQALRTMSPPPVPVDQVQTKRMVQRQASNGSLSSSARGRGRGGLQRTNSSGSMTERTFRTPSPSPSRPTTSSGPQPPPMPSIPLQYANAQGGPVKKKKRASSQETGPSRVVSPPPNRPHNRNVSLDRYGSPQQPPAPLNVPKNNTAPQGEDLERIDSRNSVNFSRPLSPRPQSPIPQSPLAQSPIQANGERAHARAVAQAIPQVQASGMEYQLAKQASQPVKKKKKKVAPGAAEGSHLQSGTMAAKPVLAPVESAPTAQVQPSLAQQPPIKKKKKKAAMTGESTHFVDAESSPRTESDSDSNVDRKKDKKSQRASGMLTKQPSIVREDWEGEQEENTPLTAAARAEQASIQQDAASPLQDKRPANAANVSRKIEEPAPTPTPPSSQPRYSEPLVGGTGAVPQDSPASSSYLQVTEPQSTRGTSLSPSRSTRFSDRLSSDMTAGQKHDPPPRSVSPAKPALKHYNADGTRVRGSSVTPSESSDISSVSMDGMPKRKKSARVSFDPEPEIVGQTIPEQNSVGSPAKEKKSWLGLGKNRPALDTIHSSNDMEELMKPRPQLPSFGSVRGGKSREANDVNAAQRPRSPPENKTLSSSATSSEASSTAPYSPGISSDHAVGAILAQNAQQTSTQRVQPTGNEPLPPEVRSVEGVLSYSDEETDTSDHEETPTVPVSTSAPPPSIDLPKSAPIAAINQQTAEPAVQNQAPQPAVPELSISPPTPGVEPSKHDDQYLVMVPGGFPISAESLAKLDESNRPRLGHSDSIEEEETTDNDSIYSDAAEDAEEMERMGFGSIDAILESPMAAAPVRRGSPPESPLANYPVQQPAAVGNWEAAQARWKGIAQQTREAPAQASAKAPELPSAQPQQTTPAQLVPETNNSPPARSIYSQVSMPPQQAVPQQPASQQAPQQAPPQQAQTQPRRKKKSPAAIAAAAMVPAATGANQKQSDSPLQQRNQGSSYPSMDTPSMGHAAAAAAPFRQSMRATSPPEAEPAFRKSMRNEARRSAPPPATTSAPQQRAAAQSAVPNPPQPRAALQKKHIPLAKAAAATAPLPKPKPAPAAIDNNSDSDSSFRKARRSKSNAGGRYSMRRSMRGEAEPTMRGDPRSGVRSVSPVGRRQFSPPAASRSMRTSMRGSMDTTPTLRGSTDNKRSSSMFGRQPRNSAPPVPNARANRSRILDSDDEDERPQAGKWRSRFAEDSDDDSVEIPHFAPVRGIPRKHNDADSTDLDDSSDEGRPTPAARPAPKVRIPSSSSIPTSMNEPLSPNSERKRGLFGMFRSKKPKEETLSPVEEAPADPTRIKPTTDTSKPSRLGFASNAERDQMIAQTRAKLEAARTDQHGGAPAPAPATGKLQRRMPERIMSDSWPLPPTIGDEKLRPSTADGHPARNGTTRLNQGSMRTPNAAPEAVGRSGKKKKFPMLRKAFGLKD